MVSVRKRGKVYEYRFETGIVDGKRKWITNSGYPSKSEAFKEGAKAELEVALPRAELVFVKSNGQFLGTDSPKYAFKVIHYELGINSRFHDFRDTHATRL